jgi:hypothetical protein
MNKIVVCGAFCIALAACEQAHVEGYIVTHDISKITDTTAVCGGDLVFTFTNVDVDGKFAGVVYSIQANALELTVDYDKSVTLNAANPLTHFVTTNEIVEGAFSCNMSKLQKGKKYYVRAFALIRYAEEFGQIVYGETKEFETSN